MKLKHLAAFFVLLAVGCAQQTDSDSTAPATDTGSPDSNATSAVDPGTDTQLASHTVSLNVTGMK